MRSWEEDGTGGEKRVEKRKKKKDEKKQDN